MAGSPIQRSVPILLTLLVAIPSPAFASLLTDVPTLPLAPASDSASPADPTISDDLALAATLARVDPEVRALLAWYAERHGWAAPQPVVRDVDAAALPAAVDAFVATFAPAGGDPAALLRLKEQAGVLPDDLAAALARLLFAMADAQALQVAALAPLTIAEIASLGDESLGADALAAIAAKANLPLALQAAATLDAAVAAAEPVLTKYAALLQLDDLANGRVPTSAGVEPSLGALARSLDARPEDSALVLVSWTEELLGHPHLLAAPSGAAPPLDRVLLLYYAAMGIPVFDEEIDTLAALSGADPALRDAVALNLAAGLVAWDLLRGSPDDELAALAPEVARIAASSGASAADLDLLARALGLAQAGQSPGSLEALALLLSAAQATRNLPRDLAPMQAESHGDKKCVGDLCAQLTTYPNGTNSVTITSPGQSRTIWAEALRVTYADDVCSLDVWTDLNGNGRLDDRTVVEGGERLAGTHPMCDAANDVLFRDPFGYVVVTGEGASILDARYGSVVQHTGRTDGARSTAWQRWNASFESDEIELPVPLGCFSFGFIFFCSDPDDDGNASLPIFGAQDLALAFTCFSGLFNSPQVQRLTGATPFSCYMAHTFFGRQLFGEYPGENLTINPESFQILTIDLGGDDTYRSNAGGTYNSTLYEARMQADPNTGNPVPVFRLRDPTEPYAKSRYRAPIAIAIDLAGDDTYANQRDFVHGASDLGVGFLLDLDGDDTYTAGRYAHAAANTPGTTWAQRGAGESNHGVFNRFAALAASIDLAGDDTYVAKDYSLAFANASAVSVFLNLQGRDSYASGHQSQAFANATTALQVGTFCEVHDGSLSCDEDGSLARVWVRQVGPFGVATPAFYGAAPAPAVALFVDGAGDDAYSATARRARDGTSDWAQGRGVDGGVGILLDLGGRDSGLPANGNATAEDLLSLRFSSRAFSDKRAEQPDRDSTGPIERAGSRGVGIMLDVEARDATQYPIGSGYAFAAPGVTVNRDEDPFWKMQLYVDAPGLFALGNEAVTKWTRDFVLSIDLAGDDVYTNQPGSARLDLEAFTGVRDANPLTCSGSPLGGVNPLAVPGFTSGVTSCPRSRRMGQTNLVGLHLDLDGADVYDVTREGAGYGFVAVGALYDRVHAGGADDVYRLGYRTGGVGIALGVGILHDEAGDDTYLSLRDPVNSFALAYAERAGFGLLLDPAGDDTYESRKWAMGAVSTRSAFEGALFLDADGVDTYRGAIETQGRLRYLPIGAAERKGVLENNMSEPESGDALGAPSASANRALALFVDDGLDKDVYALTNASCGVAGISARVECHGNDDWWEESAVDFTGPSQTSPEGSMGRGFDNLDYFLNRQFLSVLDGDAAQNQLGGSLALSPTVLALRAVLLSPGIEFTLPDTYGDAYPADSAGRRPASLDASPLPSARGVVKFEVVARVVDPTAMVKNTIRLAEFLLYEDSQRFTCERVDPYDDGARAAGASGLEQANPYGGPHDKLPFYCARVADAERSARTTAPALPPLRTTSDAPAVSALPAALPLLELAFEAARVQLPDSPVVWSDRDLNHALAQAAALAARGDLDSAQAILTQVLAGERPGVPQSPEHSPNPLAPGRIRGTEDIRRVEFILQDRQPSASGPVYTETLLAHCDLSGQNNDVAACATDTAGSGVASFRDGRTVNGVVQNCEKVSGWGCFRFDWHTLAQRADGARVFADGDYQFYVRAYYTERGILHGTAARPAEQRTDEKQSDSYGFYPGWARRLVYVDNLPQVYGQFTTVSDFIPDDLERGLLVFRGYATEPVRYQVWVRAPGEADFLQIYAPGFNQTAPDCFATTPSPAGCFSRLDPFHRTVTETGARKWCTDSAGKNVDCRVQDARALTAGAGKGVPLNFAWRPGEPVEGLYTLRIEMWDRTHWPDASVNRNLQTTATFTFWGDLTPPVATPAGLDATVAAADVVGATLDLARLPIRFHEDPLAADGRGSRLESVVVTGTATSVATGVVTTLAPVTLTRAADAVAGEIPVKHGRRYDLQFKGVDRAGNAQTGATSATFTVDLRAPSIGPLEAVPAAMQPEQPLTLGWPPAAPDNDFGADLDHVEVFWAIARPENTDPNALTYTRLPDASVNGAARTFTFTPRALGLTDADLGLDRPTAQLRGAPFGVYFRVVAVDAYGNREGERFEGPNAPEDPVKFDVLGPLVVGEISRTPAHDRAEIRWTFDEIAPRATTVLAYTKVGDRAGAANECSALDATLALTQTATLASADQKTYRAQLGSLSTNSIYQVRLTAQDAVGNPMDPILRRFCTEPVASVTVDAPFAGSILAGAASAAWTIRDVRLPAGSTASGTIVTYRVLVEADGETIDLGEARCGGSPCFETPEGSRRTFPFDTRKLPDAEVGRVVLLVNTTLNSGVPLRFESGVFAIDNTAPVTAFSVDDHAGATAGAWFASPVTVRFAGEDATTSVVSTWVSTDNRTFKPATSFRLATDGAHTLYYNSTDAAGNRETPKMVRLGVDTAPPSATVIVANGAAAVKKGAVLAEIIAGDSPSGVASVILRTGPNGLTDEFGADRLAFGALQQPLNLPAGDGLRFVEIDVIDLAGNVATARQEIVVDGSAPTFLATGAEEISFTNAVVRVATDEDATASIFVKRATDRAYQARLVGDGASNLHRVAVAKLFPGTDYEAKIVVEDALGNRAERTVTFRTRVDDTPPGVAHALAATDRAEGYLLLEWRPADDDVGVVRYAVYRSEGAGEPTLAGHAPTRRFLDVNLTPGVSYTYRVRAEDAAGNLGPLSEAVKARATTRPTLTGGAVTPESGGTDTVFRFTVTYRDLDGDRASFVRVLINGKAYEMRPQAGQPDDPRKGVVYEFATTLGETRLSAGVNSFRFEASDGKNPVGSAVDESGPLVVGAGHGATGAGSGFFSLFATVRGAPGVAAGAVVLAALGAAVVLLRRRWSA